MASRRADPTGGRLVLVATPIGNLGDLSPRAVEALRRAVLLCCEDTRRTGRLLQHAGVAGPRLAVCNEHTERARIAEVLAVLGDGGDVAVVTDAGTPGISDPGERLVRAAVDAGYEVTSVPGPTAFVTALVTSGLTTGRFVFEGFLPRSGPARRDRLAELAAERRTIVVYEAPHRVLATVTDLAAALGEDRPVAVARELTKLWETVVRGTLGSVRREIGEPRGEYVLVIAGAPDASAPPDDDVIRAALRAELAAGATTRDAASAVARRLGVPKRVVYDLAVTESRHLGAATLARGSPTPDPTLEREGEPPEGGCSSE
jgi:16S rRNA (cytidine1402-2'-O)-methyltransferase